MVTALPGTIRLNLEQTLAQWRHWDCDPPLSGAPAVVDKLSPGLSNHSFLVASSERQFVVRLDGIKPAAHHLSRQGEWHSLREASNAGLAPAPRYFNPELGSLVCDFLPPDQEQPLELHAIAGLLRRIHQLPPRHQRLDLPERILHYEKRLSRRDPSTLKPLAPYREKIAHLLATTGENGQALVLCHHDLLRANRLYSDGKLYALDWEYSAMGSPLYDLAVVAAGDNMDETEVTTLLTGYTGSPPTAAVTKLVTQYGCVYRYLELLWYLAQEHAVIDDVQLQRKLDSLGSNFGALRE